MVSMAIFISAIALGARLQNQISKDEDWPVSARRLLNIHIAAAIFLYLLAPLAFAFASFQPSWNWLIVTYPSIALLIAHATYIASILIGLKGWPIWCSLIVALFMVILSHVFGNATLHHPGAANISQLASSAIAIAAAISAGLLIVLIAPPKAFVWRLTVVLAGVATLALMNTLSTIELNLTAPSIP